jgi:hypothetical protein
MEYMFLKEKCLNAPILVLGDGSDIRITEVVLEEQINKPPLMIL